MADGSTGRRPLDGYFTPEALAVSLVDRIVADGFWHGGHVMEPSAGKGAFVNAITAHQPQLIRAVDIDPERCRELEDGSVAVVQCADFLKMPIDHPMELVLGNPPFNGAEAHVRHALSFRARFGAVAFLLRLAFLETQDRAPFWAEHPASKIYVLSERPSFTGGGTDNCAYGFFVWANWWRGKTELEVISWKGGI